MTLAQFQLSGQQSQDLTMCCQDQPAAISAVAVISGNYTMAAIETAFAAVTDRHDILRTTFEYREGMKLPLQTVHAPQGRENTCFGTAVLSLATPLSVSIHAQAAHGFQVTVRALPLVLDDYSIRLLFEEADTLLGGQAFPVTTEELLQFGDYTNWETQLIGEDNRQAADYWSRSWIVDTKVDTVWNTAATGYTATAFTLEDLPLERYAAECNVAVKSLVTALFAQSIARYQSDGPLQLVSQESGRCYDELKYTMGPLSRYYAVGIPEGFHGSTAEWATQVQAQLAQATDWNDYYYVPVNTLLQNIQPPFVFHYLDINEGTAPDVVTPFSGTVLCRVVRQKDSWNISISYPVGMALAAFLVEDLKSRLRHPSLPVLSAGEKDRQAIADYNNTAITFAGPDTVPAMILNCFAQYPGQLAVLSERTVLTYRVLEEKVKRITAVLNAAYHIRKGDIVGVMLGNDENVAAVLLGILFSGAAYVPLDPHNPVQRLEHIVKDSGCRLIITDEGIAAAAPASAIAELFVSLDTLEAAAAVYHTLPVLKAPSPKDIAYLIFTSGTTGQPKGCQISHANLSNYIQWANSYYFDDCQGNFPLLTSLAFDLTVTSIFTTLTRGKTLYCLNEGLELTEKLRYCFDPANEIDSIKLTPTHITLLAGTDLQHTNIACVIVGGEELHPSQVAILKKLSPSIRIYNEYGPTEATVGCIVKEITSTEEPITIGRPIANMRVAVLDAEGNTLPVGVYGELYLSGDSVAPGYWNQPAVTAQKFVALDGVRYYRTGDIVRLLPAGDMAFAGRADDQIKIRGYRIEMGEIKTHLSQYPGVAEVFVVARKDAMGERHITAYYKAEEETGITEWQSFLKDKLPVYMVPAFFIRIKDIPLTVNGKLDIERLPDPFQIAIASGKPYVAPVTVTERSIAQLWQEVLQKERIGLDDNFYELGGHSLLAMRAVSAIRRDWKVDIMIRDLLVNPTVRSLAALVDRLDKNMALPQVVPVAVRPHKVPLSYAQERLWFIDQLRGSSHYHMPAVFRLKGQLNVAILEASFRSIVDRHESLRTIFKAAEGIPYQELLPAHTWCLQTAAHLSADELQQAIHEEINRPFDLSADHMLRARLVRLDEHEHLLVLVRHHIASDGWSASLLLHEFYELYEAATAGRAAVLPVLDLQYADYALWQRQYLTGDVLEQQLGYWEDKLKGVQPLQLPTDLPRPVAQSIQGDRLNFSLGKELSERLATLAQQEDVTPFMLLLSVYKVLLYRYSGQTDICVGTTVAHRPQQELESLIGFFVNTLALRSDLSDNPDFTSLLSQVRNTTLEAYAHIAVPFEKVVDRVEKDRDKSRSSVFQVLFVLNNNESASVHELGDITISASSLEHKIAKFDLTFFVEETDNGFGISINYCSDLFVPETIVRMRDHYLQLLSAVLSDQSQRVGEIQMLTAEEEALLLSEASVPSIISDDAATVTSLFAEQVARVPDTIALQSGATQWSYGELDKLSDALGVYLRETYGLQPNDLVGILMENSSWSVLAMLGILKAGAAYVPIDPSLPSERQGYIISDTGMKALLITSEHLFDVISFEVPVFSLDLQLEEVTQAVSTDVVLPVISVADLAYVIYTSGTTGQPKGVMITHGNISDYYRGLSAAAGLEDFRSYGLMSSLSADLGNTVLFGSLLSGGTLHLFSKHQLMNAVQLHDYFAAHPIDCIKIVPSHWNALEVDGRSLLPGRCLIFGGESLSTGMVEKIFAQSSDIVVINHYGPTETTIGKLLHRISRNVQYEQIPIGRTFSSSEVYILNAHQQLCPAGISGELVIGGAGISPGYLHQPELSALKFIKHPFREDGGRLYRTGDLVRRLPSGDILFIGRVDDQVKIRGYRVEPGEVSQVLAGCEGVQQCVVTADKSGTQPRLIAYVVMAPGVEPVVCQAYLKEKLPDYMQPSLYIPLTALPLTSNGKIDRRALPSPDTIENKADNYVAPRNTLEEQLTVIWGNLLQVEKVGIYDNFFELGGHSLLAIRVLSALKKEAGIDVTITDLFEYLTIASLAEYLNNREVVHTLPLVSVQERPVRIPLSYAQERLWFIDQLRGSSHYHMPAVFRLKGELNLTILEEAFRSIVNRHESLRTVFKADEGIPYQEVLPANGWRLQIGGQLPEDELQQAISAEVNQAFDLSADHMLRARLFRLDEHEHLLVLVRHHIASDGWSVSLMIKEFCELYQAATAARAAVLPVLDLQYADYALWQRQYLTGDVLEQQLGYWEDKLKGVQPLQLPTDLPRPVAQSIQGDRLNFSLGKELSERLATLAQQEDVTPFMLLLSVYKVLLYRYSGQTDICVGTTVAHRPQQELESLIGFFVNTLALRSDLSDNPDFTSLLSQVRNTTLEAYAHIAVPFEKVVDRVEKDRDKSRSSVFQVLFVLNNNESASVHELGDITISASSLEHKIAKFDLTFFVEETDNGFGISINYCSDLFLPETIVRMRDHYLQLLSAVLSDQSQRVGELQMLTAEEEALLLSEASVPSIISDDAATVTSLFAEQVARVPDTIALQSGGTQWSYKELDKLSDALGVYLRETYGLQSNDLVGILMENSSWSVLAMLGILKAGAAYVPIDPSLPSERQGYIISDTGMKALLITSEYLFDVISFEVPVFSLDLQLEEVTQAVSTDVVLSVISAIDLAYVIYTSGTTGQPKGVMITHGNISDYYRGLSAAAGLEDFRSYGLMSSLSADLGNTVLFGSLLSGGTLHLFSKHQLMNAVQLHDYFAAHPIDCIKIVPSHWNALEVGGRSLLPGRCLIFGGEALSTGMVEKIFAQSSDIAVINHYGPTETTIGKLLHRVSRDVQYEQIPIGRTFSSSEVYILNAHQQLCPAGISGELVIGGAGVSPGYLHQPELSALKFIKHPFREDGGRLYRTGDLVRRLPSGDILFIGRVDDQVKIRGYRVEPGEVSQVLAGCEGVRQCVVTADKSGTQPRLIAYVVMAPGIDAIVCQAYLKEKLPDYMQPSLYIPLASLPLTSNGKIDRRALPSPATIESKADNYVAPRNETEEQLAEIWAGLLNTEKVGIHDNFFELGGDSIVVIQLVSRAKRKGLHLQVQDVFDHQTVAGLAEMVQQNSVLSLQAEQGILTGDCELSPIQQWFFEEENGYQSYFNQSILLRISKGVSAEELNTVVQELMLKHDALRFTYRKRAALDRWTQAYGTYEGFLQEVNLTAATGEKLSAAITQACTHAHAGLDISKGELVRFVLIRTPAADEEDRLFMVVHHLAIDGVSWRILIDDIQTRLDSLKSGIVPLQEQKTSSYRDWVNALTEFSGTERIMAQTDYWEKVLEAFRPLPLDISGERPARKSLATVETVLDTTLTSALLKDINQVYNTEVNDLLLCALGMTLSSWSGNSRVHIGLESHGREDILPGIDITGTVGWFTNKFPLRLDIEENTSEGNLIKSVKEQLRNVPDKGIGYACLRYLNRTPSLQQRSWDIVFNYLGQPDNVIKNARWFKGAGEYAGEHISPEYPVRDRFVVKGIVTENTLKIYWTFSTEQYHHATVEKLAEAYIRHLTALITHCANKEQKTITPSDFGLNGKIDYKELDDLLGITETDDEDDIIKF